ncbi:MAG TPA: hypothetical protein VL860_13625 [Planctomycetota bacterium]|nr:hypothetical protein [Planctomycetota bacterium]
MSCRPGFLFWVALVAGVSCAVAAPLDAGDAPPADPAHPYKAPPVAWSLASRGDGLSKIASVTRGGKKLDVLMANGGNTLTLVRKASIATPDAAGGAKSEEHETQRVTLQCELLLAEYDSKTRQIERIRCAGAVTVDLVDQSPPSGDGKPAMPTAPRQSHLAGAALEFQRVPYEETFVPEQQSRPAEFGTWSPMKGIWTLSAAQPVWTELPDEFAGWLKALPPGKAEPATVRTDRLTLLAPKIQFDPIGGHCTAGPDTVSGVLEAAPAMAATAPGIAVAPARSGWSLERRTKFSCQTLQVGFRIGPTGEITPTGGDGVHLEGQVVMSQEPARPGDGAAELNADEVKVTYPAPEKIAADADPLANTWGGYETLAASPGKTDREILLRDNELTIRGGVLSYTRKSDNGELQPLAGQKWVVNEIKTPAGSTMRLRAQGFKFHLNDRNFEAVGERMLEQVP